MKNEKRICQFATLVNNGEKPDAEIHVAGFDEGDGLAMTTQIEGGGYHLACAAASLVGELCKTFKKENKESAAAFVDMIGREIAKNAGKEVLGMAAHKANPLHALEELLEGLKEALGMEDDD